MERMQTTDEQLVVRTDLLHNGEQKVENIISNMKYAHVKEIISSKDTRSRARLDESDLF